MSWESSFQTEGQAEKALRWAVNNSKERHLIPRGEYRLWPKDSNLRGNTVASVMYLQSSRAVSHMPTFRAYDAKDAADLYLLYEFVVFEVVVVRGLQRAGATPALFGGIAGAMAGQVVKGVPAMVAGGAGASGPGIDVGMSAMEAVAGQMGQAMAGTPSAGGKFFHKRTQLRLKDPERTYLTVDPTPMDANGMCRLGGWTGEQGQVHHEGGKHRVSSGFHGMKLLVSQVTPLWYEPNMGVVKCWHRSGVSATRFESSGVYSAFVEMMKGPANPKDNALLALAAFEGVGDTHNHAIRTQPDSFTSAVRVAGWFDVASPVTSLKDPFSNVEWSQWNDPPAAIAASRR